MADLFLGIDGGQSSTAALIGDASGNILGQGVGGPCNHVSGSEGRTKFFGAVGDCLTEACSQAGVLPETVSFEAACLGLSGGAEDKEVYARELIRSRHWKITHDAEIALTGATGGKPGIMVIAGTGSMAFGRNALGKTARAGGWGYLFGDEGGALYIVRQALRACLRQEEGWGDPTALAALFLEASEDENINKLLHRFYAIPRQHVAAYARLVDHAARLGDETALNILNDAGSQLTIYVAGVHQHLFNSSDAFQVSYIGGTFQSSYLLNAYKSCITRRYGITVAEPKMSPSAGALLEAYRLSNSSVPFRELAGKLSAMQVK